jgi:hypothetical protein
MPGDPNECREHAKQCWQLASQTTNPELKASLSEIAQRWAALATELEAVSRLLTEWSDPHLQLRNPVRKRAGSVN